MMPVELLPKMYCSCCKTIYRIYFTTIAKNIGVSEDIFELRHLLEILSDNSHHIQP